MRFLPLIGFVIVLLLALSSGAQPTIERTADGGLYFVRPRSSGLSGYVIRSINGCVLSVPLGIDAGCSEGVELCRTVNIRNELATGITTLTFKTLPFDVANDRHVKIGEMKVVVLPVGLREAHVDYELPVLAGQHLEWVFRRPDGTLV